jgi:hypothetical protein
VGKSMIRLVLVLAVLLSGCLESSFRLSEESRFPIWLEVPDDQSHGNYMVTLDYYTSGKAVFSLIRKSDKELLDRVVARVRDSKPLEVDGTSWPMGERATYPIYSVVTYEGVSEIIEHMKRGPIFSIAESGNIVKNVGCRMRKTGGFICEQDFKVRKE